jgi:hypothetical protein
MLSLLSFLSSKRMLGLWATAVLAVGLALGADRAEAATVTINFQAFGAGPGANIAGALDAQTLFHGTGPKITEDFEGFAIGPSGAVLNTAVGSFIPIGPSFTGTTALQPTDEAHIRDGTAQPDGSRYNTTPGGGKYLDSNDNRGIRLEIPGASGLGSFTRLSLLATDIDDVASAGFSIDALGDNVTFAEILAGLLGQSPNGSLHLITFLFSEPISNIGINFMIDLNDGFGIDSVVLSTVPLPAAGWLLLSALAWLGFLGRRRTAVA